MNDTTVCNRRQVLRPAYFQETLSSCRGIIYKITNNKTGRCYVGQTYRSFYDRYKRIDWWNSQYMNAPLKLDIEKYGNKEFGAEILEKGIFCGDKLNELEAFYAEKFNAYYPNGYNMQMCGTHEPVQAIRDKIGNANARIIFKLKLIDTGEIVEIRNLQKFCRDNGLLIKGFYRLFDKEARRYKNYTLPEYDLKMFDSGRNTCAAEFEITHMDGRVETIHSVKNLCKTLTVGQSFITKNVGEKNKTYNHHGVLIKRTSEKKEHKEKAEIILKSPSGKLFKTRDLSSFSKEFDLNKNCMYALYTKRMPTHKGWSCLNPKDPSFVKNLQTI